MKKEWHEKCHSFFMYSERILLIMMDISYFVRYNEFNDKENQVWRCHYAKNKR